jgi:hypothetical protein
MRRCTALLLVMLSGCSLFPLSATECRPADWRARGFNDGY